MLKYTVVTQWNPEYQPSTRHSEYDIHIPQTPKKRVKLKSARASQAIKNIIESHTLDNCQAVNLGLVVASAADIDAELRVAHHRRYREAFGLREDEFPFVEDITNLAAASLIGFHRKRMVAGELDPSASDLQKSKGISAELGHVDQLADWRGTKILDEEIRALPSSDEVSNEGLAFAHIYGSEDAKIHYRMRLINDDNGTPAGVGFSRNRAVADLETPDGSKYEIIKRSSFVVVPSEISDVAALGLDRLGSKLLAGKSEDPRFAPKFNYEADMWAKEVIEPFISDRPRRERSHAVLPASCIYFALIRYPVVDESHLG